MKVINLKENIKHGDEVQEIVNRLANMREEMDAVVFVYSTIEGEFKIGARLRP